VVVLEAEAIGAGASGRNAGFVVPHFSRADPASLRATLGPEAADRLLAVLETGADRVFDLALRAGLGRAAEQTGWLQPAHSAAAEAALRARIAMWQARGRPVTWLDRGAIAARTGMTLYRGALHDASGGMVNPLALARGMAGLAQAAGARIHTRAPVAAMTPEGGGWALRLGGGQVVRADRVLMATNAATTGAARALGRTTVPLQVYQIATDPLDAATVARIAPARQPVSDTRVNIFTYRLDPENRLISGGMALFPFGAEARMARQIVERLAAELRLAAVPRVAFVWRGTAAMTRDGLPALTPLGAGAWGAVGCNGRGVAFTTALGAALARWVVAGADPAAAPIPLRRPVPVPARGLAWIAPTTVLIRGRRADAAALREAGDGAGDETGG
jgi:glycine/D-amino acid oxidase-like deaminating enzyme